MRLKNYLNEQCPLKTMYGEMPGGGGFKSYTEYELAASNMAEAAHCILGSLAKLESNTPFRIEKGHIEEETGIIESTMKEYSKDLYLMRVFDGDYAIKSIESMKKAAPVLAKKAKSAKSRLSKDNVTEIRELADAAYDFLILLANKIERSAKGLGHYIKMGNPFPINNSITAKKFNVYNDRELIASVKKLRRRADVFKKLSDDGSKLNPYPDREKIAKKQNKKPVDKDVSVDDILDLLSKRLK